MKAMKRILYSLMFFCIPIISYGDFLNPTIGVPAAATGTTAGLVETVQGSANNGPQKFRSTQAGSKTPTWADCSDALLRPGVPSSCALYHHHTGYGAVLDPLNPTLVNIGSLPSTWKGGGKQRTSVWHPSVVVKNGNDVYYLTPDEIVTYYVGINDGDATASQAGNVLTVTAITGGKLSVGSVIFNKADGGYLTKVTGFGTGKGLTGTYIVDTTSNRPSQAMTFHYGADITMYPNGFQAIVGYQMGDPINLTDEFHGGGDYNKSRVKFYYQGNGAAYGNDIVFPSTPGVIGDRFAMNLTFPECWDGVTMDNVPSKNAHFTFSQDIRVNGNLQQNVCQAPNGTHLPTFSMLVRYIIPPYNPAIPNLSDTTKWQLSSDGSIILPGHYRGETIHIDYKHWMDAAVSDKINHTCFTLHQDCETGIFDEYVIGTTSYIDRLVTP